MIYNPHTGEFLSNTNRVMGHVDAQGYRLIGADGKLYRAHRLAWKMTYGGWPDGVIHHKNHDRDDNRLCNLELSTRAENNKSRAMQSNNRSGYTGVYPYHGKKGTTWYYEINKGGKKVAHSSGFKTAEAAHRARGVVLIEMGYDRVHGLKPSQYTPSHKV